MSDQPLKVQSQLKVIGTNEIEHKAMADLFIPDPDKDIANAILEDILNEEEEDKPPTAEKSKSDY